MGRNTFESIGRPLPGQAAISSSAAMPDFRAEGVEVVASLRDAIDMCHGADPFVIGGATLYTEALPRADRIYLTEVDASPVGDTLFPSSTNPRGVKLRVSDARLTRRIRTRWRLSCWREYKRRRTAEAVRIESLFVAQARWKGVSAGALGDAATAACALTPSFSAQPFRLNLPQQVAASCSMPTWPD